MGFCLTLEFVLKRGNNKNICVLTIGLRLKLQKFKKLKLKDILPVGMDFHVSNKILYDIHNYLKDNKNLYLNVNTIKKWMWQTRSGINLRCKIYKEIDNPLKNFHHEIDNICLSYVNKFYLN